jgi:hypothetical protein
VKTQQVENTKQAITNYQLPRPKHIFWYNITMYLTLTQHNKVHAQDGASLPTASSPTEMLTNPQAV